MAEPCETRKGNQVSDRFDQGNIHGIFYGINFYLSSDKFKTDLYLNFRKVLNIKFQAKLVDVIFDWVALEPSRPCRTGWGDAARREKTGEKREFFSH